MAELGKEDGDEMPDDNKVVIVEDEAPQEENAEEIKITETAPEESQEVESAPEQPDERESIRERRRKEKQCGERVCGRGREADGADERQH